MNPHQNVDVDALPPGSFNAHWFNFFNALAFQIMMGAPVILYAKSLGASSTVLGIIAAFTPLMTVFQLPAAQFLERYGYKEFVLMGWSLRTIFIVLIALTPLLWFLDDFSQLAFLMACLFLFNLLRGISSAAWMPWITALIPSPVRGKFLSRDQIFMHLGCLIALLASALVMTGDVDAWEYSLVFGLSAAGGFLSLVFIRRIPGIPTGETTNKSAVRVPWGAMLRFAPFQQLLIFNLVFMVVIGSLGVFSVEFLREIPRFGVSLILFLSGISFVGALLSLPFTGRIVDRAGSRPVLAASVGLFGLVILGWFLVAAGIIPATLWSIAALNFFAGIAGSNYNLANVRIAMIIMPEMGRNHFFALFTVITSLGLGAAPVMWGMALDTIGTFEAVTGALIWRRHSIYFLVIFVCNIGAWLLILRVREPGSRQHPEAGVPYGRMKRFFNNWFR
jgi:MFS family permease